MNAYIGIDLGTSGVKALLVAADGTILKEAGESYPVLYPREGWTQQRPSDWLNAVKKAIKMLVEGQDASSVRGISLGGQMHGLVVLDGEGEVIRPAILWNDGRTESQTDYLNKRVGKNVLVKCTGNVAFAGFTAPKILWLKQNEPQNFAKIDKIMLPKDYIVYALSGSFCTDYSDAAGTLLLDVEKRRWSRDMCGLIGVNESHLPRLCESFEAVGTLKKDVAKELNLSPDVKIIAGAGDNAAAAVGTGAVTEGDCNISLGTSGTAFICTDKFCTDENNALHAFCHANGKWHLMGCILSAASARKWWLEDILGTADYNLDEELAAGAGKSGVYFAPYLSGERCPHNDVNARGAFMGLSAQTTRAQMSRAVMEGVAFALKDCLELSPVKPSAVTVCGGGARSAAWRHILADVFGVPVKTVRTEQGPSYGAAILAMVGCGQYGCVEEAARSLVAVESVVLPDGGNAQYYSAKYRNFKKIYPALKGLNLA